MQWRTDTEFDTQCKHKGIPHIEGSDTCILLLSITFMQGIYSYVPETNHVPSVCIMLQLFYSYNVCYT
jgi:hypothetical protein